MNAASMHREEMIEIVRRICAAEGPEEDIDRDLERLQTMLPDFPWSDLIYWPSGFPHDSTAPELSPEQIVHRALSSPPGVIVPPPPEG